MFHEQADHSERGPGGFETAAAAGSLIMGVLVLEGGHGDGAKVGGDIRQVVGAHDGERPTRIRVQDSVLLHFGAVNELLPLVHGGDFSSGSLTKHAGNHLDSVLHICLSKAEFLQLLTQIGRLDLGFRDLLGKLRHGLVPLAGFLGSNGSLLPCLAGGLAVKAIRSGEREIIQLCLRIFHGWPGLSC